MPIQILPFVRYGAGASRGVDDTVTPTLVVHRDGAPLTVPPLPTLRLRGAGHVVALDPAVVTRRFPAPLTAEALVSCFPHVELAEADMPWRYSPGKADPQGRLAPWLVLAVVERQEGVTLRPATRDLPATLSLRAGLAVRELPRLQDRWAWAHVQTAQDLTKETPAPHFTFARLIGARRLLPGKRYIAALVPALRTAVQAGRGEPVTAAADELAWTDQTGELTLPAYDAWEFATSLAELDFELLAGRIKAEKITPAGLGDRRVDVASPGAGLKPPPAPGTIAYRSPLTPDKAPDEGGPVLAALAAVLAPAVAKRADVLPAIAKSDPVVKLPRYGGAQAPTELQTDVRWRIAAGLGRELVARHQEALVAEVWDQLAEQPAAERRVSRGALGGEVGEAIARRVRALSDSMCLQVTARMHAKIPQGDASVRAHLTAALHGGLTAPGLRRMLRSGGAAGRAMRATRADRPALQTVTSGFIGKQPAVLRFSPTARRATAAPAGDAGPTTAAAAAVKSALRPRTRHAERTQARLGATALVGGRLPRPAPRLLQPLARWLTELGTELMLPGAADVPKDRVLKIASDRRFVEALLAGANQALHAELAWREVPVDPRATLFDRFWEGADQPDILPLAAWTKPLGQNGAGVGTTLLLRAELLRLLPNVLVYALTGTGEVKEPTRFGRLADDTMYVGFELALDPHAPGWWLVLEEASDGLRFGVDLPPADDPIQPPPNDPNKLHWGHLVASAGLLAQLTYAPPGVPGKPQKNAAQLAPWFLQRPIRLTIHTSKLQPTP